jgi:hypothetical protein
MIYGKYAMKIVNIAIINAAYYKGMKKSMNAHIIINVKKNAQFVLNVNVLKKIVIICVIISQDIQMFINACICINVWKTVV